MTPTVDSIVRSVVVDDIRTAAVFDEMGIDYCCQGDRTIGEACRDTGLVPEAVVAAVAAATERPGERPARFDAWDPAALASYIVSEHHEYTRATLPTLVDLARRVATMHGDRHPEFHEVAVLIGTIANDLHLHMLKEERILFPYISDLVASGRPADSPFGSVENPIRMMEREHDSAGRAMARVRQLLHGYVAPEDAGPAYRECLEALQQFERDLHTHMHLENNILFPKTRELEARSR